MKLTKGHSYRKSRETAHRASSTEVSIFRTFNSSYGFNFNQRVRINSRDLLLSARTPSRRGEQFPVIFENGHLAISSHLLSSLTEVNFFFLLNDRRCIKDKFALIMLMLWIVVSVTLKK